MDAEPREVAALPLDLAEVADLVRIVNAAPEMQRAHMASTRRLLRRLPALVAELERSRTTEQELRAALKGAVLCIDSLHCEFCREGIDAARKVLGEEQ